MSYYKCFQNFIALRLMYILLRNNISKIQYMLLILWIVDMNHIGLGIIVVIKKQTDI